MHRRVARPPALLLAALLAGSVALAGCGGGRGPDQPEPTTAGRQTITVTSTAFSQGHAIPLGFSCDGTSTSPPLSWKGVPATAQGLALVVSDPDAAGGTFYHWVVTDIPITTDHADQGAAPPGGIVADNSAGDAAYLAPCPPSGTHHYRFTVYALSSITGLPSGAGTPEALDAIVSRAITSGTLVGTFSRG